MTEITRVLSTIQQGDAHASAQLLPLKCAELRRLLAATSAKKILGSTLEATALVHEAYLRLVGPNGDQQKVSRGHYCEVAAEMRRILVEHVRRKNAENRCGGHQRVAFSRVSVQGGAGPDEVIHRDTAPSQLGLDDPDAVEIAKLRLFGGMMIDEAGKVHDVSRATAFRDWTYARAWLNSQMQDTKKPNTISVA